MVKESLEFFISYLLSKFAKENEVEVKDIKVKTERTDSIFVPRGNSYICEITYK